MVYQANIGEYRIELFHPPPPETENIDWNLYNPGSVDKYYTSSNGTAYDSPGSVKAKSRCMIDALLRLLTQKEASCKFYSVITDDQDSGLEPVDANTTEASIGDVLLEEDIAQFASSDTLNDSQVATVNSCDARLSLI